LKHLVISMLLVVFCCINSSYAVQSANIPTKTLHQAATDGDVATVNLLISGGADVNKNTDGFTPLHRAAEKGHKDIVEILITKGADVNAKGNQNITPLHLAATWGKTDVAEILIAKGADVNAEDKNGRTPLGWAQLRRRYQVVQLLQKHGATDTTTSGPNQTNVNQQPQGTGPILTNQQIVKPVIDLNSITNLDPITDPNNVKERVRKFQGLEQELNNFEQKSDEEINQWNDGVEGCTPEIVQAIYEQIAEEYEFIRKQAVDDTADKTTTVIDGMLLARKLRLDEINEKMQEDAQRRDARETRRSRLTGRSSRGRTGTMGSTGTMGRTGTMDRTGTRGRTGTGNDAYNSARYSDSTRLNGRRRSRQDTTTRQQIRTVTMNLPFTDPNIVKAKIKTFEGLEKELKDIDRMAVRETRGWSTRQSESSPVLAKAVYKQVTDELTFTRKIAIEENAAKTTIAIDGLLLNRHGRFDRVVKEMQEEKKRLREELREELRSSRTRTR